MAKMKHGDTKTVRVDGVCVGMYFCDEKTDGSVYYGATRLDNGAFSHGGFDNEEEAREWIKQSLYWKMLLD